MGVADNADVGNAAGNDDNSGQQDADNSQMPGNDDKSGAPASSDEGNLGEGNSEEGPDDAIDGDDGQNASTVTTVYLDQYHGNDSNDGVASNSPVKTIEKANAVADTCEVDDICLQGTYTVSGTEAWDLGGKTVHRCDSGGYMIELADSNASLTLSNVIIDGKEVDENAEHTENTDSIINAMNGGSVTLCSGAVLQNNSAAQWGSAILALNGAVVMMEDGSKVCGNSNHGYELGTVLVGNSSSFIMNGGEISENSSNGGGGVAVIGSSMTVNGGVISGNNVYRTTSQGSYGGAIYLADWADASGVGGSSSLFTAEPTSFEMNGGMIADNTALDYGGAICTFPQKEKDVKVAIKGGEISRNQAVENSGGAIAAFYGKTRLSIEEGTIKENKAARYGGGILLNMVSNASISGGLLTENEALYGGGMALVSSSAEQVGGRIEKNVASWGGGVFGGTYTMTGGTIASNNSSLSVQERRDTRGDGVCVGPAFNVGEDALVDSDNDVYLRKGASIEKEGCFVNVISPLNKMNAASPVEVTSQNITVEDSGEIGTQLVRYESTAGGEAATQRADLEKVFVPSWKMSDGLSIGQSNATGKTDWLTYVRKVKLTPMDITVYTGGDGYSGVVGEDGEFSSNDLPDIGFYVTLPDDLNQKLGSSEAKPVNLSGKISLTYDDSSKQTTRSWSLQLYGSEEKSWTTTSGRKVYIYKLLPSKINGTDEDIPSRVQFTDAAGNVMTDSKFPVKDSDQYRNYKMGFYTGDLDPRLYKVSFSFGGTEISYPVVFGTGELRVRGNVDKTYRDIQNAGDLAVDQQDKDIFLVSPEQNDTRYYVNGSSVGVSDPSHVKLLVDYSLDDALLKAYIEKTSNAEGKYSYQFRYLDLVDTGNGNAYVTMDSGQKMDLYWPVPNDAKADSEFHIVHFKGLDRDANVDMNDLWSTNVPEEIRGEKVTIDGRDFVKFAVDSFSPFALLYEKSGGATSGGSGGSSVTPTPTPTPDPSPLPDPTPTPTPTPDPDEPGTPVTPSKPGKPSSDKPAKPAGSNNTASNGSNKNNAVEKASQRTDDEQATGGDSKLPQTGQLWWPAWLMGALGVLLIACGIVRGRRKQVEAPEDK